MSAGRPLTLTGPLSDLARLLGEEGLCEAMGGVAYSTIWRWDKGLTVPQRSAQVLLADIAKANGMVPPTWPRRVRRSNKTARHRSAL